MVHKRYTVRLSGRGNLPACLTKLKSVGMLVVNLSVHNGVARFETNARGIKQVRKYRRRYGVRAKISSTGQDPGLVALFASYRYLVALILPFVGSLFLWHVEVESDMPEVAERIEKKLESADIVPFRPLSSIPDEGEIRRDLMQDDPSLSWVRFKRIGTSLTIIPMLSPTSDAEEEVEGPPSDLIARTGGIITRFALTRGERVKEVHSTVEKGDVLATGVLEQGDKKTVVGAAGAVFADYWVEYTFTVPKLIHYKTQGEEEVKWVINLPWKALDEPETPLWPIISTEKRTTVENFQLELAEGMEETVLVPLLKEKLLAERGADAIVKDSKILHVTFDDDKVKGAILFHVNDNIAIQRPISKETEAIE